MLVYSVIQVFSVTLVGSFTICFNFLFFIILDNCASYVLKSPKMKRHIFFFGISQRTTTYKIIKSFKRNVRVPIDCADNEIKKHVALYIKPDRISLPT